MRILARLLVVGCLATLCACCAGCLAGGDPLGETSAVPPTPSSPYVGPSPRAPRIPPSPSLPQDLAGEPMSLGECIYIALRNNPQVRASWYQAREAAAAVGGARSRFLPQLEFSASSERRKSQVLTEVEAEFLRTIHNAQFQLQHVLLDGGQRLARLEAAEASLLRFDLRHNQVLLEVALRTEQAYYELLAAQALLEVAQETLEQRKVHLQLAEDLLEAGMRRVMDVAQARAEVADAELSLIQSRNQLRLARGQLVAAMGLQVNQPIEVQDVPDLEDTDLAEDIDRLLVEAARNRPQLQSAAAQISSLRHQLRAQRAARMPALSLQGTYGWIDEKLLWEEREEYSLGLNLQVPIFTGFQITYNVRQVEEQVDRALAEYEQLLRGVELEVWQAYSDVLEAEEAVVAAAAFVESARGSLEATERAFRQGVATIAELTDAQTALTRALARRIRARLQLHSAVAQLERAIGRSWQQDAPTDAAPAADGIIPRDGPTEEPALEEPVEPDPALPSPRVQP